MSHFSSWLAGFVDGEGSFAVLVGPRGVRCRLTINLRVDDVDILHRIQNETGLGRVTVHPARDGAAPQARWEVLKKGECLTLVEMFDSFPLLAKKARDYTVWRRAVLLHSQMARGQDNSQLRAQILHLKTELQEGRKYDLPQC